MDAYKTIGNLLEDMGTFNLVEVHNKWCDRTKLDRYIYYIEDFNELMQDYEPLEIAKMTAYGSFSMYDEWYELDARGHIRTFANPKDNIFLYPIIKYIVDERECFGDYAIFKALQELFPDEEITYNPFVV